MAQYLNIQSAIDTAVLENRQVEYLFPLHISKDEIRADIKDNKGCAICGKSPRAKKITIYPPSETEVHFCSGKIHRLPNFPPGWGCTDDQ